jgi:hypothetical protein
MPAFNSAIEFYRAVLTYPGRLTAQEKVAIRERFRVHHTIPPIAAPEVRETLRWFLFFAAWAALSRSGVLLGLRLVEGM